MKIFSNVSSSQEERPLELEVNVDTVYYRKNIKPLIDSRFEGWQYDETQYTLREYQEQLGLSKETMITDIDNLGEQEAMTSVDIATLGEAVSYLLEEIEKLKSGSDVK